MIALVLSLALTAAPKVDARLVGTWNLAGQKFVTLNADGTGSMEDDKVKWSADGKNLTIVDDEGEADRATYALEGSTLTMNLGGTPLTLTRGEAAAPGKKQSKLAAKVARAQAAGAGGPADDDAEAEAMAAAQEWLKKNGQGGQQQAAPVGNAQRAPAAGGGGRDQLAQLLTSSAWCYFAYSKISGATTTERFVYSPNGTWSTNSNREAVNSGPNGSVYSANSGGNGGRWQTQNNVLFMSEGDGPVQQVQGLSVTRNSNGYPIIQANGREYSMCN